MKTPQKPARWSKWDSFRDGRQEIDSPKEMAKLRQDIDAGWRYFIAQKTKRQVLEQ